MKIYNILLGVILVFCAACFDDKGNYDYHEVADITIENLPNLELLAYSDHIVCNPKITSSTEGVLSDNDPNYEYAYDFELKGGGTIDSEKRWVRLNPSGSMNLDTIASFPANSYICWFKVTDKRTGCTTSTTFDVRLSSTTYEGWLVLCNDGADEKVRLDMISVISAEREAVAYNILSGTGMPEAHRAIKLGFSPNMMASGELIYLFSEDGGWRLDQNTLATDESYNVLNLDFIINPGVNMADWQSVNSGMIYNQLAFFCVLENGNAYALILGAAGAAFELPINTSTRGGTPEYRVAPYIGVSKARPGNGSTALFYDIDNKRFVGWTYGNTADSRQVLYPLSDPDNKKFSFQTGMDLVYMESTRFSNGLVYSILQGADGNRHVYGINMSGNGFVQESVYENIQATNFKDASLFAFHSQYPYMFYAVGNQVYLYNLGTSTCYPLDLGLKDTETVTMLKFNLYENPALEYLNNQSDEFMNRQYELIVGTYDSSVAGNNGGKLTFYQVSNSNTVSKRIEYTGFGKIKDVLYRERR